MRKLLMATAGVLGATMGGFGVAQAQIATIPTLMPGSSSGGGGGALAGQLTPAPGTVIIRLGGQFYFYASAVTDSASKATIPAATTNNIGAAASANTIGVGAQNKENPFSFSDYARLYPSIDGVAANGLQYGALVEIRHEAGHPAGGSGVGNQVSGNSSASANNVARGQLYVRREYGYFGMPQFGTLRFGSTDGPSYLFETGTFENVGDGMWNGSLPNTFDQNTTPIWPFSGVGNYYTLTKAVYLSPSFSGFDFGAAYAPNTGNTNDYGGGYYTAGASQNNNFAEPGSDRLSASSSGSAAARLTNMVDVATRYRGAFGPVGVAAQLGWIGSTHVNSDGATPVAVHYNGMNIGDFGATVTFAGFTVGGHFTGGAVNGSAGLKPVGSANATAYLGGVSYTVGPAIVGASFFQYNMAGNSGPLPILASIGQERDRGIAVGGTYTLAPGVSLFFSYLYGDKKENGWDFIYGQTSTAHNQIQAQGVAVGTNIRW